jgi:hypothetical protein
MNTIVVPHDPTWKAKYESEAKAIAQALGTNLAATHHIFEQEEYRCGKRGIVAAMEAETLGWATRKDC